MSIREDLNKRRDTPTAKRCKVGTLLDSLQVAEPDEYDALLTAIDLVRQARARGTRRPEEQFTIQWLSDVLNGNNYILGKTVVSDHVREVCACDHCQ